MQKFTLYVGLNDKDTKMQKFDTQEAENLINYVLLNHVDGATIFQAKGIYKHENGIQVVENTLRIELLFTDTETVKKIVEILKDMLNQESIAVQIETVNSELW